MKKNTSIKGIVKLTAVAYLLALVSTVELINGCNKRSCDDARHPGRDVRTSEQAVKGAATPKTVEGNQTLTSVLTVAGMSVNLEGNTEVIFNENTEYFTVSDASVIATLKEALSSGKPMQVSFDPWKGVVVRVVAAPQDAAVARRAISSNLISKSIDLAKMNAETLDEPASLGVMNTTSTGLVNVVPDFATAQLMFEYISKQCCRVPGPYGIDYCIPFQYCIDGCYARAHKMCYIINNKYHYGTQKIFSFALPYGGPNKLCVQGQKWGGCCIRWWYHVAPLVTVQTPTGPKAYVFDPAMFDQPVLLSQWLHAQENPVCAGSYTAKVTNINVQPTSSYTPSGTSGTMFSTDPMYTATNNTLFNYRNLVTCP